MNEIERNLKIIKVCMCIIIAALLVNALIIALKDQNLWPLF
jgi:hypothetical protein